MRHGGKVRGTTTRFVGLAVATAVTAVLVPTSAVAGAPRGGTPVSPATTVPGGASVLAGVDTDGTYGVLGTTTCGDWGLETWAKDGTAAACVPQTGNLPAAAHFRDRTFAYTRPGPSSGSIVVYVTPPADTAFQIGTTDAFVGLVGGTRVLTESTAGVLTLRGGPGTTAVVVGRGLPMLASGDLEAAGGDLAGKDGHLYQLRTSAGTTSQLPNTPTVAFAQAIGGPDDPTAVLTTDRRFGLVAKDGTFTAGGTVPGTDVVTSFAGSATTTVAATATAVWVGGGTGVLHRIGIYAPTAVAAAGEVGLVVGKQPSVPSAGTTDDGQLTAGVFRIGAGTSPLPAVGLVPSNGPGWGRTPQIQGTIDQDVPFRLRGDPSITYADAYADDQTPLPPGPHTVSATVDAVTGQVPVTTTFTVVAHDVYATVGTNHHVYLFSGGRATDLGGYAASAPSVQSVDGTAYVVVQGSDGLTYLRTPTAGWTRITDGSEYTDGVDYYARHHGCNQPSLTIAPSYGGYESFAVGCADEQARFVQWYPGNSPSVRTSAPSALVMSPWQDLPGTVVGPPVLTRGFDAVLGTRGVVYELIGSGFRALGPTCAGPLGGAGVANKASNLQSVDRDRGILACRQGNGTLGIWRLTGTAVVGSANLGGGIVGRPSVAMLGDGSAVVTVLGTDNALYRATISAAGVATAWQRIGGSWLYGVGGAWVDGP